MKKLYLFVGLPGSGKTTVCKSIAEKNPHIVHQSVGDLLRAQAQHTTQRGRYIHDLIAHGKLVPVEITLAVLEDFLAINRAQTILLDGYQGTQEYIEPFHQLLNRYNILFVKLVSFDVSTQTAFERSCLRMRADDAPEALKSRLEVRLNNLATIEKYYAQKGLLERISADRPVETVISATESLLEKTCL
jgi:adenylate kinase